MRFIISAWNVQIHKHYSDFCYFDCVKRGAAEQEYKKRLRLQGEACTFLTSDVWISDTTFFQRRTKRQDWSFTPTTSCIMHAVLWTIISETQQCKRFSYRAAQRAAVKNISLFLYCWPIITEVGLEMLHFSILPAYFHQIILYFYV